jgi:hypothetical protein
VVRVFKTKLFSRFARKERLSNRELAKAVQEIEQGLLDGDLGGHLVKKRMARAGGGKRGGYRTILAYRKGSLAIFLYGFAKNVKADLSPDELQVYQNLAGLYVRFGAVELGRAVQGGELQEIEHDKQEISQ